MTNESNKVAIVTGASRGHRCGGRRAAGRDGFTVVINYSGDAESAEALATQDRSQGGRALTAQGRCQRPAARCARMFDAAEAAFGGVDVLVNNAGIMKLATIADTDDALFDSRSRSI